MARGNVQSIPTGTQTLQRTLNAEVRNAIRVLNPNDGIVYVSINGQASPVTFDFVVPSQSYAALPGPWMEYGLYFLDQSGAGRTGVITVYESDERLDFPDYHAIGRSLQAQVTTLDITQGPQPANPPVGVSRLWVDSAGAFGYLLSSGPAPFDIGGYLRSTNIGPAPTSGVGVEIVYGGATDPTGYVSAFDRGASVWKDILLRGKNVQLVSNAGGAVIANLPYKQSTLAADFVSASAFNNGNIWIPYANMSGIWLFIANILVFNSAAVALNIDAWVSTDVGMIGGLAFKSFVSMGIPVGGYANGIAYCLTGNMSGTQNVYVQVQSNTGFTIKASSPVGGWAATSIAGVRVA